MGLLDILKRFGKKAEDHVKINPFVRRDVDPFLAWEKEDKIGDGAFGEVFRGRQKETGRLAAIKQIGVDSEEDLMDYMVEINILTKCKHKTIIELFEAYLYDSKLWLCLEYCKFGALDSIMIELDKGLAEPQIRMVCREVTDGLKYLHSQGVIHRDLKAGNVLLTSEAVIKLADFGVSAMGDSPEVKRNSFIGSQYWMAPEVMACETYNEVPYGTQADVWSLGVTLIELAQMLPPHHNMQPMRVAIRVIKGDPPRLERPKQWSDEFNHFLSRCLVKTPETRANISELLSHKFISGVQESDRRVLRNLIAELQASPEVEVEEVDLRESELRGGGSGLGGGVGGGGVRDSIFPIADLDVDEDAAGSSLLHGERSLGGSSGRLSAVGEAETFSSSSVGGGADATVTAAVIQDDAKSEDLSASSPSVEIPPTPPLEPDAAPFVEPAAPEAPEETPKADEAPTPASSSSPQSPSSLVQLPPQTPNAVVPPPDAFATVAIALTPTPNSVAMETTDSAVVDEIPKNRSPRSSVSSETIESDNEEQRGKTQSSIDEAEMERRLLEAEEKKRAIMEAELAEETSSGLLDEVLLDESQEPSIPAVVMQVMQEELNEVSNIDELISSSFNLAIGDHDKDAEEPQPQTPPPPPQQPPPVVTDIDAVPPSTSSASAVVPESSTADQPPTCSSPAAINVELVADTSVSNNVGLNDSTSSNRSNVKSGYGSVTVRSSGGAAAAAAAAAGAGASLSVASEVSSIDDGAKSASGGDAAEETGNGIKVVRRPKDAKFNSVIIKKKRVFVDESGQQVVTTTIRTVRKGDERKIQDQFIDRREQLREQKLLNKAHQKQDTELSLRHELEKQNLEQRFRQELQLLARDFDAAKARLRREADEAERQMNQQFEKSLRQETQRAKEQQERGLRDLRDSLRQDKKRLTREELKNSQRELKEKDKEAERSLLQRLAAQFEEHEAAARVAHRKKLDDRQRALVRDLHALERKYRQEREECEERHLYERFEMRLYQHSQHWLLKKQQAMERHERDLDRLRKQADAKRDVLNQSQALERRRRPKLLKKEQATRMRMFRESLLVTNPGLPDDETRRRLREFDESEKERCQTELSRLEGKLARAKDEFERRVARVDTEVRHEQQEMRKLIAEREADQRRDLEAAKRAQLKEFQELRRREKEALEQRMADEMRDLEARLKSESRGESSGLRINGEGRSGGAAAVTQA
ncbi:hypothetical protein BOX15_Mlig006021g1 [Macrostomum lignano]|uniref:Protein kinase domain-containing protein n=1 Tax=Macrostomum lignano TaxID=282301 RepID=A0A267F445_9PLAT|nr:hypothetical protein BOX15_Mlig006021g1 [Macrostomum lignano]